MFDTLTDYQVANLTVTELLRILATGTDRDAKLGDLIATIYINAQERTATPSRFHH